MKIVPVFPFGALEEAISLSVLGIVKIDVEGGEADILTSMCEALRRDRPWLVVEIFALLSRGQCHAHFAPAGHRDGARMTSTMSICAYFAAPTDI